MDSEFVRCFVAVVKHGSIAAASRELNVTAGAISVRLKALEKELGTELIQRSGRTVVATEAGAKIFTQAQTVLREVDELRGRASGLSSMGPLRLGVISSAATCLVPHALRSLEDLHPTGQVSITRGPSTELYRAVCEDTLDMAYIVEPNFTVPKSCRWQAVSIEPLVLLTHSSLAGIDPNRILSEQRLIRYDRTYWGASIAEDYLSSASIEPRGFYEVNALDSVAMLVEQQLGVSLIPDWAGPWAEGRPLQKQALPSSAQHRVTGFLWSTGSVRQQQIQDLIQCSLLLIEQWRPD